LAFRISEGGFKLGSGEEAVSDLPAARVGLADFEDFLQSEQLYIDKRFRSLYLAERISKSKVQTLCAAAESKMDFPFEERRSCEFDGAPLRRKRHRQDLALKCPLPRGISARAHGIRIQKYSGLPKETR
jgi:hypothetical protein